MGPQRLLQHFIRGGVLLTYDRMGNRAITETIPDKYLVSSCKTRNGNLTCPAVTKGVKKMKAMNNTWPEGHRHPMTQNEHEKWNGKHYPGTRQLCSQCDQPTGRCEEDMLQSDKGPVCEFCWSPKEM